MIPTDDEINVLVKLAVIVKKRRKDYKLFVVFFGVLGILTGIGAVDEICSGMVAGAIVLFAIAVFSSYMAVDGIKMMTRRVNRIYGQRFRLKMYQSIFLPDGVQLCTGNGNVMFFSWQELDAFVRMERSLWVVTDRGRRYFAFYLNAEQVSVPVFEGTLQLLEANHIPEENIIL